MTSSGFVPIYLYLQKLLLFDSAEEDSSVLRQHCSELTEGKAHVLKMQPNTIDIVPLNASKGGGIRILLDHLGITEDVRIHSHQRTICSVHFCALYQSLWCPHLKNAKCTLQFSYEYMPAV